MAKKFAPIFTNVAAADRNQPLPHDVVKLATANYIGLKYDWPVNRGGFRVDYLFGHVR